MKKLKHITICLTLSLLLTSCIHAINIKHRFEHKSPGQLKAENKANIAIDLYVNGPNGKQYKVHSFWTRIDENGNFAEQVNLTNIYGFVQYNNKRAYDKRTITPGTYFLNGFEIILPDEQPGFERNITFNVTKFSTVGEDIGWDGERNQPKYLAFKVEAGQYLTATPVRIEFKDIRSNNLKFNFITSAEKGHWIIGKSDRNWRPM